MDFKKFVKTLSESEQNELKELLDAGKNTEKLVEEARQKKWQESGKKELIAEIDAFLKEIPSLAKEEVNINIMLKLEVKPEISSIAVIKDNLMRGSNPYLGFKIRATVSAPEGEKSPAISLISSNVQDYFDDLCEEVLVVFPEYAKQQNLLNKKMMTISEKVRTKSASGLKLKG